MSELLTHIIGHNPNLASAEQRGSFSGNSDGFIQEEYLVARAVAKRRDEFFTTRHCARLALATLGIPPCAIGKGDRGQPCWPPGIVGSLTHCEGFCGALVGRQGPIRSIGIDAEPHRPLPPGVLNSISLLDERAALTRMDSSIHADRILFCAKEATYKTWFPLTGRWLGFEDARITLHPLSATMGRFHVQILINPHTHSGAPITSLSGSWLIAEGLIVVGIVL